MSLSSVTFLKKRNIEHSLQSFPKSTKKGVKNVAAEFGMEINQFLKSLIFEGSSGKLLLCLIEGDKNLDTKLLKKAAGEKDVYMAKEERIEKELGFKIDSIPPFGLKSTIDVFIDEAAMNYDTVGVGAGEWGQEIFLTPQDLHKATKGVFVPLVRQNKQINWDKYTLDEKYKLQVDIKEKFDISNPIKNIAQFQGKEVNLNGWIWNKRSSGGIYFLQLRDGSGFIQVVVEKSTVGKEIFNRCEEITLETSVVIKGTVRKDERAPTGYEVDLLELKIVQLSDEYPIQKKDHGIEFLLDNRHLWLRSRRQWAIQQVRNTIINAIYAHLGDEGFIKIDAPILTPNACEGTTTLFPVPYLPAWKKQSKGEILKVDSSSEEDESRPFVYLSQSGQLYLEAAIFAHGKVFDFGPTFRAEKSKTRRHLTEFWMMDAEAAFVDHKENMRIQEGLTKAIVHMVLDENTNELEMLKRDLSKLEIVTKGNYPIISHKEAVKIAQKGGSPMKERDDPGAEDEKIISKQFDKPVFIEKYPKEVKAFYMKDDPNDPSRVLNNDMLAPEGYGEVIGGSQREDDYHKLLKRIKEENLQIKDFEWYLDLRKYGSVPHSGFGIGLERYVAWICGLKHIRETIPFPRMIYRMKP